VANLEYLGVLELMGKLFQPSSQKSKGKKPSFAELSQGHEFSPHSQPRFLVISVADKILEKRQKLPSDIADEVFA
jgi:hypothetical protein